MKKRICYFGTRGRAGHFEIVARNAMGYADALLTKIDEKVTMFASD